MDQKDALLLILLFAAAEDRGIRETLSSALSFYRENRDMLALLFAPNKKESEHVAVLAVEGEGDMLALLFAPNKKDGAAAPSAARNGAENHANCTDTVSESGESAPKTADSVSEFQEGLTIDPKVLSAFLRLQQRG